jgi:hypothetical protein
MRNGMVIDDPPARRPKRGAGTTIRREKLLLA